MKLIIVLGVVLAINAAQASDIASGRIIEIRSGPWYGDSVVFKIDPAPTTQPSCASSLGDRGHYAINTSDPGGAAWLSMILSAHSTQQEVQIWGRGTCINVTATITGEELEALAIKKP